MPTIGDFNAVPAVDPYSGAPPIDVTPPAASASQPWPATAPRAMPTVGGGDPVAASVGAVPADTASSAPTPAVTEARRHVFFMLDPPRKVLIGGQWLPKGP